MTNGSRKYLNQLDGRWRLFYMTLRWVCVTHVYMRTRRNVMYWYTKKNNCLSCYLHHTCSAIKQWVAHGDQMEPLNVASHAGERDLSKCTWPTLFILESDADCFYSVSIRCQWLLSSNSNAVICKHSNGYNWLTTIIVIVLDWKSCLILEYR